MTSKLKVSEIFGPAGYWEYSQKTGTPRFVTRSGVTQGEGMFVGKRSVFLRTFGCNLRCPSFGLEHGQKTDEPQTIAKSIKLYDNIGELPAAQYGCDSYYSVYPEFKSLSPLLPVDDVIDQLEKAAGGTFFPTGRTPVHLVITGGEPLLPGWTKSIEQILQKLQDEDGMMPLQVTFETNGTQPFPSELQSLADSGTHQFTLSISPKLKASGHDASEAIDINNLLALLGNDYVDSYLKFVVQDISDFDEIDTIVDALTTQLVYPIQVYIMPEGGTVDEYKKHATLDIVAAGVERGYDISPRLQVMIGDNVTGW